MDIHIDIYITSLKKINIPKSYKDPGFYNQTKSYKDPGS